MYITFEVAGDEQLKRSFSRFGEQAKDLSEPFREIVKDFHKIEKRQFESEGSYGSGGWQPLSPRYAAWKAKKHPGRPLMVVSGLLKESPYLERKRLQCRELSPPKAWRLELLSTLRFTTKRVLLKCQPALLYN